MATATQEQGIFSLTFKVEGCRKLHALDWDAPDYPKQWSVSRWAGTYWERIEPISEKELIFLISSFGLVSAIDALPLGVIRRTGPKALIMMRRRYEKTRRGFKRLQVKSNTVGCNVLADDHVD